MLNRVRLIFVLLFEYIIRIETVQIFVDNNLLLNPVPPQPSQVCLFNNINKINI